MTDLYAVFGNPIEHSKSPDIHAAFAAQTGQDMVYSKQLVALDGFSEAADAFFAAGGKGLNITVPFKQDAYSYAARLTSRARHAGAVNTLALKEDGTLLGDNTDGAGMVHDILENLGWQVRGKKVLVLGAGGAVRGVLEPLLEQLPQHVVIANRTIDKALQLARGFAEMGYLLGCGFDMLEGQQFDLVINGTSASLSGELPPLPDDLLTADGHCYDMMYAAQPTPFLIWARQHGARVVSDGLGMLVEQAAESFKLWRGVQPDTKLVISQLRDNLS
ncbi:MAG: shikimate dehydrogenase [Gammaproteobacteria bacterium]|nr:MAG: shikimate dehydrogenase [Gammaproteobacteria bacterium]